MDSLNQSKSLAIKEDEFEFDDQNGQRIAVKLMMKEEVIRIVASLMDIVWNTEMSLDESCQISEIFLVDQSIQELFLHLQRIFNSNEVSLESNDQLMLLKFNLILNQKNVQFQIPLKLGEVKIEQIIRDLQTQLAKAEEKIELQNEEIELLKQELQKLKIQHISKILQYQEMEMVYSWISNEKVVSHLDLLYKASEHGFQSQAFSLRCDGKGPLICFIRSQNKRRFGGFIHLKYQKNLDNYEAANPNLSFIFSLDDKKQYLSNEINNKFAYYSTKTYGFAMGSGCDLCISDECNISNSSYSNLSVSYGKNQGGNNTSLAGSRNFVVDEIEVFQVMYKE